MQIKGLKKLNKQLSKLSRAAGGKALRSAALSAMLPALKEARASAPVRKRGGLKRTYKGRLVAPGFASRNLARKTKLRRDKKSVISMLGVKPEAFYALSFIELGTSKISRRPWLEPAFRRSLPAVKSRFQQRLKQVIARVAK